LQGHCIRSRLARLNLLAARPMVNDDIVDKAIVATVDIAVDVALELAIEIALELAIELAQSLIPAPSNHSPSKRGASATQPQ